MTDNLEFLSALHELSSRSINSSEFLGLLIEHDKTPEVFKPQLAEAQSVLNIQAQLIRKLAEEQLSVQAQLEDFVEKINPTE